MIRSLVSVAAVTLLAGCASAAAPSLSTVPSSSGLRNAAAVGSSSGAFVYVANVTQFNIGNPPSVGSVLYFPAGSNGNVEPTGVKALG